MAGDDLTWYVVPTDGGWLVTERTRGGGKVFPTKSLAVAVVAELARAATPSRYQVRRADGTVEREVSFGAAASVEPTRTTSAASQAVSARRMSPTPADAPSSKRMRRATRVLLVDDEPLVRASFCRLLSSRGWEVILAPNCEEVNRTIATQTVHAAIIDFSLPGSEALAERLLAEGRATRVVFFTGKALERDQGATAFGPVVRKGNPNVLLDAIRASA